LRRETKLWLEAAEEELTDAEEMLKRQRHFRAAFF